MQSIASSPDATPLQRSLAHYQWAYSALCVTTPELRSEGLAQFAQAAAATAPQARAVAAAAKERLQALQSGGRVCE